MQDFPKFVAAIEWTTGPCGGCDKICSGCPGTLKRWTPEGNSGNQFVYDLDKAKKGHLPLTSALRGTFCEFLPVCVLSVILQTANLLRGIFFKFLPICMQSFPLFCR